MKLQNVFTKALLLFASFAVITLALSGNYEFIIYGLGAAAFAALIDRTGAAALIPEDASREIIKSVPEASTVLTLMRRLPNMTRAQHRMPVLSALPTAYFVTGDTGQKQTTNVQWANKYLNAEELAVIVPIPESVLADVDYDIWGEIRPLLLEAFGVAIDAAIIHGTNAPASWPTDIVASAQAAHNGVQWGTYTDLYDDIMGPGGVLSLVEQDGFNVTGHIGGVNMKGHLRGLRTGTDRIPLFQRSMQEKSPFLLDGAPIYFPMNAAFDQYAAMLVSGDFNQAVYSIRQDITYKILSEATLYDTDGTTILYRLAQQDMVALRAVIRLAWQVPNPIKRLQTDEDERYPFAVLEYNSTS